MGRRRLPIPASNHERRQFHSVSDVRRETSALYWQCKAGKVNKGIAPSLVNLLDMIAHYMSETEAEVQAQRLREQIEEARNDLLARGVSVPAIIEAVPERLN